MLSSLHIRNFVLIDSLDVKFPEGLVIITGQTGAGKSILLGALGLLAGAKADASMVSEGAESCVVEGEFDTPEGLRIIRRVIYSSGRSRSFIDDCPVQLPELAELGGRLFDIHSQHHNLLFHNADFRIAMLDEFARTQTESASYRTVLKELKQKEAELSQKLEVQRNRLEKRDFMQFVYDELSSANLQAGEQDQLEQDIDFLSHTETIKDNCFRISNLFSEKEENVCGRQVQ